MKKTMILIALLVPSLASANVAATFYAASATSTTIQPNPISGTYPAIYSPFFVSTSSSPSTFFGSVNLGGSPSVSALGAMDLRLHTSAGNMLRLGSDGDYELFGNVTGTGNANVKSLPGGKLVLGDTEGLGNGTTVTIDDAAGAVYVPTALGVGGVPGYALDILGDAHIAGPLYDQNLSAGSAGSVLTSNGGIRWIGTSSLNIAPDMALATGTLQASHGGTGATSLLQGGFLYGNGTSAVGASTSPTVGYLSATSSAATSTFAGALTVGTRIGVGTSSPGSLLGIQGTTASNQAFLGEEVADTNGGGQSAKLGATNLSGTTFMGLWFNQATPSISNYTVLNQGGNTYFNSPGGQIDFRINNNPQVVLQSNNLSITPAITSIGFASSPVASVSLTVVPGNSGYKGLVVSSLSGQTADPFQVASSSGSVPLLNVTAAGKLGVGTTSPATAVDVNGNVTIEGQRNCNGLSTDQNGLVQCSSSLATTTASFRNLTATKSVVNTLTPTASSSYVIAVPTTIDAVTADTLTVTCTYTNTNNVSTTATFFPMGLTSAGLTTTGSPSFATLTITPMKNTAVNIAATVTGVGSIAYDIDASIVLVGTPVN